MTYDEYDREINALLTTVRLMIGYAVYRRKPLDLASLQILYDDMCRACELLGVMCEETEQ